MEILILALPVMFVFGGIGYMLGQSKEAAVPGFWLGFLLGPLGAIFAAFLDRRSNCPTCGTKLNGNPVLCPSCFTKFKWNGKQCTYFPPDSSR